MKKISLEELDQLSEIYNNSVANSSDIDPICSRTEWIIPFQQAFMPNNNVYIWQNNNSFIAFAKNKTIYGHLFLTALEAMWGFPSPFIGSESIDMLSALLNGADDDVDLKSTHFILCGLPNNTHFIKNFVNNTAMYYKHFLLEPTYRCVASLTGGVDGFLKRRSYNFQNNLKKALRRVSKDGVTFHRISQFSDNILPDIYNKILNVERRSWKGLIGQGTDQDPMKTFYYHMLKRIATAGFLRLIFAKLNGEDIGYIYGTYINKRFRGLQFSFDNKYADLSLGNIMQYRMIEWLCEDKCMKYDLGSVVPYKKKWAETFLITKTIYLKPYRT